MPAVSFVSSELADISYNGVQLLSKVQIENPNGIEIPFPKIVWKIFLDGNFFIDGIIENNQHIKPRETTIVEVPVTLNYLEVFDSFGTLKGKSQVDCKITLAVNFPIPVIGDETWNFEHEGNIPLLQEAMFTSPIMEVLKVDATTVELYVSVNVENPNVFELPEPRLNFDYKVYDTSILRRRLNSSGPLAPSSIVPVVFGLLIYYADVFRILPMVQTEREAPGQLNLSMDFPVPAFDGEPFDLQMPGILPLPGR